MTVGRWCCLMNQFGTSGVAPNGRMYLFPVPVGRACHLAGVALGVTVIGDVGGVARHGVYADANGAPGALVQDFGVTPTDAVAVAQLAVSQVLAPIWYWQACVLQLQPTTRATVEVFTANEAPIVPSRVAAATPAYQSSGHAYFVDGVAGALPATAVGFQGLGGASSPGPAVLWMADA